MWTISIVIVGLYFDKYREAATGFATSGTGVATFIMEPIITYILSKKGWQGTLVFQACFVAASVVLGAVYRPVPTKCKN